MKLICKLLDLLCRSRTDSCQVALDQAKSNIAYLRTQIQAREDIISDQKVQIEALKKSALEVPTIVSELTMDIPTSRDKPSPTSSLTREQVLNLAATVAKRAKEFLNKPIKYFTIENTNSMEWLIDANTVVVAEQIDDATPIHVGDIVVYDGTGSDVMVDGWTVMHRIIKYDEKTKKYLIKGDNNLNVDGWIDRKYFLWKPFCFINGQLVNGQRNDD